MQCGGQISVLSVTLIKAIYTGAHGMQLQQRRVHDHKVEMESDAERRRLVSQARPTCAEVGLACETKPGYECSDIVEQKMIPGGSNHERLTNT